MKLTISTEEIIPYGKWELVSELRVISPDVGLYPQGLHESLIIADGFTTDDLARMGEIIKPYLARDVINEL